jgi:probable F420-dependent oxidoreductase
MTNSRPFRFGAQISQATSRQEWREKARKAEALGYNILQMPDHLGEQLAIGPALAVAAEATTALRIGTLVWQNDLRHPTLLAKEIATLDLLSDGRFEPGIGAGGSYPPDFTWSGIPFDPPKTRVDRLEESLHVIKAALGDDPVTFAGQYYTIAEYQGHPKPVQRPHPALFIGGGGRRMLTIAARAANIVGLLPPMLANSGQFDLASATAAGVAAQIETVREAAGPRFPDLELNILVQRLIVTDDAQQASEDLSRDWKPLTPEEILDTPCLLIGTIDDIVARLRDHRDRLGITYYTVFEHDMDAFAPIVERLAEQDRV